MCSGYLGDVKFDPREVVAHSLLNEALRSEFTPLISFLEADPVIERLASWCFKRSFTEKPEFKKMSCIARKLFTSVILRMFEIFLYSNRLASFCRATTPNPAFVRVLRADHDAADSLGWPRLFAMHDDVGALILERKCTRDSGAHCFDCDAPGTLWVRRY